MYSLRSVRDAYRYEVAFKYCGGRFTINGGLKWEFSFNESVAQYIVDLFRGTVVFGKAVEQLGTNELL